MGRQIGTLLRRPAIAIVTIALLAAACGGSDNDDAGDSLTVVATTTILGDVVQNVVGDNATVEVLLPIGADPHDYQASSQQIALIQQADLVVANGLLLEEGLLGVLESAADDGANVVTIGDQLDPIPFGFQTDDDHSDDPHVWLDPLRMAEAGRIIARNLGDIDPSINWGDNAVAYAAELSATDQEIAAILGSIPDNARKLVTNHGALGYFAQRYDFAIIGTVIPGGSTIAEPSSAELADLIDKITTENVTAIFAETSEPAALAEAVAAEVGESVTVVDLYTGSLGEPGSGAETLIGLLLTNAERIAKALS